MYARPLYVASVVFVVGMAGACSFGRGASDAHPTVSGDTSSSNSDLRVPEVPRDSARPSVHSLESETLPYPEGVLRWPAKNTGEMGVDRFASLFYTPASRAAGRTNLVTDGFVDSYRRGWMTPDGRESEVWLTQFSTAQEAREMYDGVMNGWLRRPAPASTFADPAVGGGGEVIPTPDFVKKTETIAATAVGSVFVYAHFYSPGKPDKAAVESLVQQEVDRLNRDTGNSSSV